MRRISSAVALMAPSVRLKVNTEGKEASVKDAYIASDCARLG